MSDQLSLAQVFAQLSEKDREEALSKMTPEVLANLRYDWKFWARPNQMAPEGLWTTWLVLAGRGFGKTRMGAEWVRDLAEKHPGCRIALVAETAADARDVMIKGDSGLLATDPNLTEDSWSPTNRCLTWPNGSKAWCYNATEPDQLRGPQHHFGWVDELAKFRYAQEIWDQLMFGLRLGEHPQVLVTTTPRPLEIIKKLMADPSTYTTRGSTLDNKDNLAASTVAYLYDRYKNTRLGRQELEGEVLGDIPGALWNREDIDNARRTKQEIPDMERIYVAVDPAASSNEGSDEHGIIVVGMARDEDGYARGYILEDGSMKGTPEQWGAKVIKLYRKWEADKIIAEKNNGGEMVSHVIKSVDRSAPVKLVHASKGKFVRAEPISSLYEQGRVHHVGDSFDKLEDQMCEFSVDNLRGGSNGSPDRVDALVWGLTEIFDKITSRRRKDPNGPTVIDNTKKVTFVPGGYTNSPNGWMAG